jgi:nitroimidazol reductase NimA-like FMN-containing flavoprotein (pyridoxamine 5'-phosphate oxidase superfamily)
MTDQELKQEIAQYVKDIPWGVLAYVRPDGVPVQRTFGAFVFDNDDIVFSSRKAAAKVPAILNHPKVSFFLERMDQELGAWKSVLYTGEAAPIEDPEELKTALNALAARSPFIKDMVERNAMGDFQLFRLRTSEIEYLDFGKGFGHVDKIACGKAGAAKA